jgi:hypothetical protein
MLMRIIRTELYFDPRHLRWHEPELIQNNPGVACSFVNTEGVEFKHHDLRELTREVIVGNEPPEQYYDEETMRAFLGRALCVTPPDFQLFRSIDSTFANENASVIDFILTQPIIVEQSPPVGIPLNQLLKGASATSLGAMLGYFGLHEPLLFATVPAGILIIGAVANVNKAMEKGLNHAIEKVIRKKRRRKESTEM